MAARKTSGQAKTTSRVAMKPNSKPTASHTSVAERKALLKTCEQIGALIIGQRHDRMSQAVDVLGQQARSLLLQQHLDVWVPRFQEHIDKLEKVVGKDMKLDEANLVNDLRQKVSKAGYESTRDFLIKVLMPALSYHGLLVFLNNNAKVALPDDIRNQVVELMNPINKVLGAACAGMVLQDTMGM
jgi:hypothetical protein